MENNKKRGGLSGTLAGADRTRGGFNHIASSSSNGDYTTKGLKRQLIRDRIQNLTPGKGHAVHVSHRDNNSWNARYWRQEVHDVNCSGELAVINNGDGSGYYVPDLTDPDEIDAAYAYIAMLRSRAAVSLEAAAGIEAWLESEGVSRC